MMRNIMPKGGHNAKPTSLKVLEGTYRRDRAKQEPKPRPVAPACPPWLDAIGRAKWRELKPKLERLALLSEVDGDALGVYCSAWSRYQSALNRLRAADPQLPIEDVRKLEISVEKGEASVRMLGTAFGLSPAARTHLDVQAAAEDDTWGGILR